MQTIYGKSQYYGHNAETNIDLDNGMTLKIRTSKRNNGSLSTTASCCVHNGIFETHRMYQDFMKTAAIEAVRCTANLVKKQHAFVLTHLDEIKQQALDHYNSPEYKAKYPEDQEANITTQRQCA